MITKLKVKNHSINTTRNDAITKLNGDSPKYSSSTLATTHRFYMSGKLDEVEKYTEWLNVIKNCNPNDVIILTINCYGGYVYTAVQLRNALELCPAYVVVEVEGACFSAATMFLNIAMEFTISPYATFMFHDYSGGVIGKGSEMYSQITHDREWSKELDKKMYKWILSNEEMEKISEGADLWFKAEEMIPRLKNYCEQKQKENELDGSNEGIDESPKKKSRKNRNKNDK